MSTRFRFNIFIIFFYLILIKIINCELATTILSEQSIDNISYGTENRYTSMLLMQAISEALDKAAASENADRPESSVIY